MASNDGNASWDEIIGDRKAADMEKETAIKFHKDKKSTNAYKRLMHLQTLFKQIGSSKAEEKKDNKDNDDDNKKKEEIFKPIDDILDITRGQSKKTGDSGNDYNISGEADLSLDCNFQLKTGKYYYEVELIEDPSSYKDLNIGFAQKDHSARTECGYDGISYGYNGVKNKLFNMNTDYGKKKWSTGDILGFLLDYDENNVKIEFYLNGETQGVAFENVEYSDNLFIGFTMQKGQNGTFIFDENKLKSKKPDGYSCINFKQSDDSFKIDGDIKCEKVDDGFKITANAGFPTVILNDKEILKKGNKYYFELLLGSEGCMQLGFADTKFEADAARGSGIGDDSHSWGVDLLRMQKWGIFGSNYCNASWTKNDIIGCCLDLDEKKISYSLNGKDLGVAFEKVDIGSGLHPCISIRNVIARQKLIEIYMKQQQQRQGGGGGGDNEEELKMPDPISYLNLIFSESGLKYKPNDYKSVTETVAFKAMEICNGLKEYSYDQYKQDYAFMDTVIKLDKDEDFDKILSSVDKDTLVVCDFWATWCGPCVYIAPHYHAISEKYTNVVFLKADVDKLKKLSQEKDVQCMPTFKFFKNGEEIKDSKIEGADKDKIMETVEKYSK